MYGVAPGQSDTASGHATLTSTMTAPATSSCRRRRHTGTGAKTTYASPSAGHPALQHLGHERQADDRAGEREVVRLAGLEGPDGEIRAEHEQQDEQCVRVVHPRDRD